MNSNQFIEALVEKIENECGVMEAAQFEHRDPRTPPGRKRNRFRDIKRSESKIIAYKEVLQMLLDSEPVPYPQDVETFLANHNLV